uniref:Tctex1 domain-containing protein 2 n=2 Tax=Macrostomum lignano TaxID=282301 RepID=A0A1I8HQF8_9PLAT
MASDLAKDRAARNLRKQSNAPATGHFQMKHLPGGRFSQPISSVSQIDELPHHGAVKLENSYQLGPHRNFPVAEVHKILKDVLEGYLAEERYEEDFAREMSKNISQVIRGRIKELQALGRYKFVVVSSIGMNGGHGLAISSRCLWNDVTDNFASYQFRNNSLYAVATVFAVYLD